jgi:hypothetical protein
MSTAGYAAIRLSPSTHTPPVHQRTFYLFYIIYILL